MDTADLSAWRASERTLLIAARVALGAVEHRRQDEIVTASLLEAFPCLRGAAIGIYWPMKGEFDPRVAALRLRRHGSRVALPVVERKAAPLRFVEWWPGLRTEPGVFGLPVPRDTPAIHPDAVLAPPVGFDARGFRLGYGGGYFDRTLAALRPRPLAIGVTREASRMATIHPQPHDVPMDFIVTERAVYENTPDGLLSVGAGQAAAAAAALIESRRLLGADAVGALLNELLEAERAGAAALREWLEELPATSPLATKVRQVQRDEGRNCLVLLELLRARGVKPSRAIGGFARKMLALDSVAARLELLDRGQSWVARRIAQALPRIEHPETRRALEDMHASHLANIELFRPAMELGTKLSRRFS